MISKEFLSNLEKETGIESIFIDTDKDLYDYDYLSVMSKTKSRTYRLPKKLNEEWIIKKINVFLGEEKAYKNIVKTFKNIIPKNVSAFPTTYGIGITSIYKTKEELENNIKPILNYLKDNKIIYKTEFSDHFWVYRIIISKKEQISKR